MNNLNQYILALTALVCLTAQSVFAAESPTRAEVIVTIGDRPDGSVNRAIFGGVYNDLRGNVGDWDYMGLTTTRDGCVPGMLSPRRVEPQPGTWNWKDTDAWLLWLKAKHVTAIATLLEPVDWMMKGGAKEPADWGYFIEEWSKFAAAVVRYINVEHKAGIRYWEIWNEPDASHWFGRGWGGDPEHYSALFNSAVKSMKQVDPSIKVGTGGIADPYGGSLKSWWEPCLRDYGINRSIDFVCLHGYYGDPTNGHWLTALRNARALMRQYLGHEIPIWVTEFNADFRADFARRGLSYEKQSLYVAETLALFAHQKIDAAQYFCIGWYGSDFCPWESTDGGKRRPVVEAYHFWQDYRGQRMPVTVVGVKGDIFAVACRDGQKQVLYLPANQSSAYRAIFPGSGKPKRVVAQAFTGAVAEPLSVISTPAAGRQWEVKFSLPEAKPALVKVEVEW